jgi:hypothetical protein
VIEFFTTDRVAEYGVKILGYGASGTGKTLSCATAPDPFVVSAEAGALSLARWPIPGAIVHSLCDLEEVYRWVVGSAEARRFATVCVDSSTEIGEVILHETLPRYKDGRLAYTEVNDKMMTLLRAFRDIQGKHVYITAKEEWTKDEASGVMRFAPMMPGKKLSQQLPYLFDEVFRLAVVRSPEGARAYVYHTQADYNFEAKDRSGVLAPIEQPNLTAIIDKIAKKGMK